ncbi:MAG TPA: dTMP kinase [Acidimicrobiales bacterium]|nr:dTMP kinase [Acidimicrobiales bacterium]
MTERQLSDVRGRLIAFEGGEAAGKSTQARVFAARLGATLTREPGGTALGRQIRALVLDPSSSAVGARAEALLLAADRAQHVDEVVIPALEAGCDVVTDRFSGSTFAYQGWGRGLDLEGLRILSSWAAGGLEPDLVVLLNVPPEVANSRLASSHPDRLEALGEGFHSRVAEGYRALAASDPERWIVVDGAGDVDEVADRVWRVYETWCGRP